MLFEEKKVLIKKDLKKIIMLNSWVYKINLNEYTVFIFKTCSFDKLFVWHIFIFYDCKIVT